jgi:hypothetical protein
MTVGLLLMLVGCVQSPRPVSPVVQVWSRSLTDKEKERYKEAAWNAAASPAMWEKFKVERLTTDPVKLSDFGIEYYVDRDPFDIVEVAIPSGGLFGRHSTYIGVTISRRTFEVLGMEESCWF